MPTCFVIQPFNDEDDRRYDEVYKPALEEAGVEPYRVDRDPTVTVLIETIEKRIRESDICPCGHHEEQSKCVVRARICIRRGAAGGHDL